MDVCCYIIKTHYGTYYCGVTNSIIRRWKEHVKGQSKYLSIYKPKKVIYLGWFNSYDEALRLERYIKRYGVRKFVVRLKLVL